MHILSRHCSERFKMLTYCDVIDTRADRQQLWRHNDRLFRRVAMGAFLAQRMPLMNCARVWYWADQVSGNLIGREPAIICIFTTMGQPLPIAIVTSQWPIVSTGMYGRMILRSARVEGIAITHNCLVHDFITLHIVVEWFITAHWETKQFVYVLG